MSIEMVYTANSAVLVDTDEAVVTSDAVLIRPRTSSSFEDRVAALETKLEEKEND